MKAQKRTTELEFVLWDGSDEAFEEIKTLTATIAKASYKLLAADSEETGTILIPTSDGWEFVYEGDYVFVDPTQSRRHMSAEEFLAAYEVLGKINSRVVTSNIIEHM